LFAFAVSLSYSQQTLWTGTSTVTPHTPYNNTFGPFNLHTTASLKLTYSEAVQVCLVYAEFMLPKWTEYNAENCVIYYNATKASGDVFDKIELLEREYSIGVYLSAHDGTNSTVHMTLTGDNCTANAYWDSMACIDAVALASANDTFAGDFAKGETKFWTYMTDSGLSHFTLSMVGGSLSSFESVISARYNGGSYVIHDVSDTNGTLTVYSPRMGMWVFSVHAADMGNAQFHLEEFRCGSTSAGPGCTIPVLAAFNNMSLTITPEDGWMYLRFTAMDKMPLLVSVTTGNGSNIPFMYATRGQIPVKLGDGTILADIHNCNRDYCSMVRSIIRNITTPSDVVTPEEWYVGIFTNVPGNTTFGLWWNNTCVPDCDTDNHGECDPSGRCQCEIDFEGIDCSISKGLGPQYIVLIIIASLVVASAIIGFVAWAYMRRKRANYEIVS
jgi:hypothetical protein